MKAPEVAGLVRYITPDGRLTVEGMKLFRLLLAMMNDHETRIEALEP